MAKRLCLCHDLDQRQLSVEGGQRFSAISPVGFENQ
jgi:hypothetical protein